MRIDGDERSYRVDGCLVTIKEVDGGVGYARSEVSEHCTFDAEPFLISGQARVHELTFGALNHGASTKADCLVDCGREQPDWPLYRIDDGSMANGQVEVLVEADQDDPGSKALIEAWEQMLEKVHGKAWVSDNKFNCGEFPLEPQPMLDKVRVKAITVGRNLPDPSAKCDGLSERGAPATGRQPAAVEPSDMGTANVTSAGAGGSTGRAYTTDGLRAHLVGMTLAQVRVELGSPDTINEIDPGWTYFHLDVTDTLSGSKPHWVSVSFAGFAPAARVLGVRFG